MKLMTAPRAGKGVHDVVVLVVAAEEVVSVVVVTNDVAIDKEHSRNILYTLPLIQK
jgi:hypothetical protein